MANGLFSNDVLVNAELSKVKEILVNPKRLLEWVPEISSISEDGARFSIDRVGEALNPHEVIQVVTDSDQITYQSTEGKLAYQLVFQLDQEGQQTRILESLYPDKNSQIRIPLKLLAPIAKRAFNKHLRGFAELL